MSSGSSTTTRAAISTPTIDASPTTTADAHPKVAVTPLVPGSGENRRENREERRALRLELPKTERDESGDEEDATTHSEEAGHDPCREAEENREDDGRPAHDARSQIPIAVSRTAKPYVNVLVRMRCCHAVPATAPTAAGNPTSAA